MRLSEQYELINRFRRRAPVDVEGLAGALGADVRMSYLDPDISGMLERRENGRFVITVNARDSETRQRFTVAHELGHMMLHPALVGDGVDDDRAYRSTIVGKYHNTRIGPREETQANKFAANILMPRELIDELKADGITEISELARKLGVSEHAMSIREGVPYDPGFAF